METIRIPAPDFELHELVWLHWNGSHPTRIISRWYELDKDQWTYGVAGAPSLFPAQCLELRTEPPE